MKVLLINGSPHAKGSTYTALHEMEKVFTENGIEAEIVHIGNKDIRGCVACGAYGTCRGGRSSLLGGKRKGTRKRKAEKRRTDAAGLSRNCQQNGSSSGCRAWDAESTRADCSGLPEKSGA